MTILIKSLEKNKIDIWLFTKTAENLCQKKRNVTRKSKQLMMSSFCHEGIIKITQLSTKRPTLVSNTKLHPVVTTLIVSVRNEIE